MSKPIEVSKNSRKISRFLKSHAIMIDEGHIDFIMKKNRNYHNLKSILQEAGYPIDSSLLKSLENSLQN